VAGFLEISGTIKSGNIDETEGELDGRLDWKADKTTTFFVFKSEHEWIDGKRLSNEGLLHIRNVISLKKNLSFELFGQINYDKKILVDNRELLGAGIRYRIFRFDNSDVTIGSAYMFEREKYDLSENSVHPAEVNVNRWSNYVSVYLQITPAAQLAAVIYYQPMLDTFSDYRILSENSLTVVLTQLFSLSFNFRVRHDSNPPDGIKKTDTKTDVGIALKF
jgi:hypothetical protein